MDRPIVDPPVPYVGAINGGLSPGKMVRIQGIAAPAGNRFDINLQVGPQPQNILALHLSVRLNEGYIARNSCEDGDWGEEEGTGTNPIAAGQRFEIIILVDHSQYKIAVNGQHFGEFRHRIAFTRVTHLAVEGDVTLTLVSWEGSSAPPPQPGIAVPLSHGGNPGDMPPSYNSATGAKAPIGYTPVPQQPLPPVAGPGSRGYQPSGPIPTRRVFGRSKHYNERSRIFLIAFAVIIIAAVIMAIAIPITLGRFKKNRYNELEKDSTSFVQEEPHKFDWDSTNYNYHPYDPPKLDWDPPKKDLPIFNPPDLDINKQLKDFKEAMSNFNKPKPIEDANGMDFFTKQMQEIQKKIQEADDEMKHGYK